MPLVDKLVELRKLYTGLQRHTLFSLYKRECLEVGVEILWKTQDGVDLIMKIYDLGRCLFNEGDMGVWGFETFIFNPFVPNAPFLFPLKTMECIELDWLCKHMKNIRSSQASVSINSSTELSKIQFFLVGIVNVNPLII